MSTEKAPKSPAKSENSPIIADAFLKSHYTTTQGHSTLHYYKDTFWTYNGTHYEQIHNSRIENQLLLWLDNVSVVPNRGAISLIMRVIQAKQTLDDKQALPGWVGSTAKNTDQITFNNGILNLRDMNLKEHTPLWFSPHCLPYNYDPDATCPLWLDTLATWMEGDPERIQALQEWFGYCLTPDTSLHKAFLLYGKKRSGKSTTVEILRRMLGEFNTSDVRLELFDSRFDLSDTAGKLLNISEETDNMKGFHTGLFKVFVAGGSIQLDRKYQDPITVPTTARLIVVANEHLKFYDSSGAVAERIILIPYRMTFAGKEDEQLVDKLACELPGILNWALQGRKSLYARGPFVQPAVGQDEKTEMIETNNHVLRWAATLVHNPGCKTSSTDILEYYLSWCKENGIYKTFDSAWLAQYFRSVVGLHWHTKKSTGGRRVWPDYEPPIN